MVTVPNWSASLVGKMHVNKVSQDQLAEKMGISREFVNAVLNGRRELNGAKERFNSALEEIIKSRGES